MFGEIQFELSGFHTLLLFLIVGGAIAILFLEIRKIKVQLNTVMDRNKNDQGGPYREMEAPKSIFSDITDKFSSDSKNIQTNVVNGSNETKKIPLTTNSFPHIGEPIVLDKKDLPKDLPNNLTKDLPKDLPKDFVGDFPLEELPKFDIDDLMKDSDSENNDNTIEGISAGGIVDSDVGDVGDLGDVGDVGEGSESGESGSGESESGESDEEVSRILGEFPDSITSEEIDTSGLTVSQLKNILLEKNLPISGNKTKLIQRIKDNQ